MKKSMRIVEVFFDTAYLLTAFTIGIVLLIEANGGSVYLLAGLMALILMIGDSFHLVPRIIQAFKANNANMEKYLGLGKQIASMTMAVFYLLLWTVGISIFGVANHLPYTIIIYLLFAIRLVLCLLPQNKWYTSNQPINWAIYRNIPFFLQGMMVATLYFLNRNIDTNLAFIYLAIVFSFAFYLPVVIFANRYKVIGILMLPKTLSYVYILVMFLLI